MPEHKASSIAISKYEKQKKKKCVKTKPKGGGGLKRRLLHSVVSARRVRVGMVWEGAYCNCIDLKNREKNADIFFLRSDHI